MCCSVVFGVTLRLLVINISSSSSAINTAAYYQRCVITCEMVAVHRRPRLQHLPVAALTQAVNPDQNRDFCLPHLHSTPPLGGGVQSEYCYAVWCGKKLEWRGYPMVKKFWWYVYSFWHNHERDRHTDGQTPHDDIGRAGIALHGKNKLSRPLVRFCIQNSTPYQYPGSILHSKFVSC